MGTTIGARDKPDGMSGASVNTKVARRVVILVLAGIGCAVGCSSTTSSPDLSKCNTCDGNVAVTCDKDCKTGPGRFANPQRTDCEAQKCVVTTVTDSCTYSSGEESFQRSSASCM
jgi:hypothetical protein